MHYLVVVQPIPEYDRRNDYCMPLGIAYINGALREAGFHVYGLNMMFTDQKDPFAALAQTIIQKKIDVLLCGGLTSELPILRNVYKVAREANPNIIIIGGGGGFTSEPLLFSQLTNVDYAVIGEGERTNVELCNALEYNLPINEIKGIVYRNTSGDYCQTPDRPIELDVDSLPFPSYEDLCMDQYLDQQSVIGWYNYYGYYSDNPRLMPMLLSRSCPYQCSFCFHPIGNQYRTRGLDSFFRELDMWIEKYSINGIALIDECFSISPQRVIEFCQRIKPYHIAWACQMRANTYTDEMIATMKDSGCIGACFGIESMSDPVLANMKKSLDRSIIERALDICYRHGIGCAGNLIFGAEVENFSTIKESIDWCREHSLRTSNQPITNFDYIQTYPGSKYYQNAICRGLISDKAAYIEKGNWLLNITSMQNEDYNAISLIARFCNAQTYNRGELIDWDLQDNDSLRITTRCFYCHKTTTYQNIPKSVVSRGRIHRLGCRHCNRLNEIVFNTEKYPIARFKAIDWMLMRESNNAHIGKKLTEKGITTLGLCGLNMATKYLFSELSNSNIEVLYVTDRKTPSWIPNFACPILDPDKLPDVDLVIVTDVSSYEKNRKFMSSHTVSPIASLEDFL